VENDPSVIATIELKGADDSVEHFYMSKNDDGEYVMTEQYEEEFSDDEEFSDSDEEAHTNECHSYFEVVDSVLPTIRDDIMNPRKVWEPYIEVNEASEEVLDLLSGMSFIGDGPESKARGATFWRLLPTTVSCMLHQVVSKLGKAAHKDRRFKCWVRKTTSALQYLSDTDAPWGLADAARDVLKYASTKSWFNAMISHTPHVTRSALSVASEQHIDNRASALTQVKPLNDETELGPIQEQENESAGEPEPIQDSPREGVPKTDQPQDSLIQALNKGMHGYSIRRQDDGAISILKTGAKKPMKAYLSTTSLSKAGHSSEHTLVVYFIKPQNVMTGSIDEFLEGSNIVHVTRDSWDPKAPRMGSPDGALMDDFISKFRPAVQNWKSEKPVKETTVVSTHFGSGKKPRFKKGGKGTRAIAKR
jgi:hypothetical protein